MGSKLFLCKECGQRMEADEELFGEAFNCPNCNKAIIVPTPLEAKLKQNGTLGFVLSVSGILTCGLLFPLGLIISSMSLRKCNNGLAIAGVVLGLIGTIYLVLFWDSISAAIKLVF